MHIGSQGDCNTLLYHSNASGIQHVFCTNEQIDTQFCINLGIPHSKDRISACSDMLMQWTWSVSLPLLQWVSHRGLIGEADTARSSQGHPRMPSSSPFDITCLEVGQEYFVRVAARTQSGSGTFSSWESVTTSEGLRTTYCMWYSVMDKLLCSNSMHLDGHTHTTKYAPKCLWDIHFANALRVHEDFCNFTLQILILAWRICKPCGYHSSNYTAVREVLVHL